MDEEPLAPLDESARQAIQAALRAELPACDIVVLEDYNKGVLDDRWTPLLIADARSAGKQVVVDPARVGDYRRYRGATVIKPNRYEAAEANRSICVPGAPNKAIAAIAKLVPDDWALALMASQGSRFRKV